MNFPGFTSSRSVPAGRFSSARTRKARDRRRRFVLEPLEDRTVLSSTTWTGATSNLWSVASNWTNGTPTSTSDVIFDGTGTANSTDDLVTKVQSLSMNSGYTGALSLGTNLTVTGAFDQEAGTFSAGAQTLTVDSNFTVNGTVGGTGTFDAGTGTVTFGTGVGNSTANVNAPGQAFYNVTIAKWSGDTLNAQAMRVNGLLTINSIARINGTVHAYGDVITTDTSVSGLDPSNNITGTIEFDGNGAQTLSAGPASGTSPYWSSQVPNVAINKTGGSLKLDPTNPIGVTGSWTNTSKTTIIAAPGGVASTVSFEGYSYPNATTVDDGGKPATAFQNVVVHKGSADALNVTSMNLNGDLTIQSVGTMTGQINVAGNVTSNWTGLSGNLKSIAGGGTINMNGGGTVAITANPGAFPSGGITINKAYNAIVNANVTTPLAGPLVLKKVEQLNGTFTVGGDVATSMPSGSTDGVGTGGTLAAPGTVLVFDGTAPQTLTSTIAGGSVPGVQVNAGSTLTISASGGNSLAVTGDWNNLGTVTPGADITFRYGWNGGSYKTVNINDGGDAFHNVTITRDSNGTIHVTSLTVDGDLTFNRGQYLDGTINVVGDVTTNDSSLGSHYDLTDTANTGTIKLIGSGSQTIAANQPYDAMGHALSIAAQLPSILIAQQPGGTVTIAPTTGPGTGAYPTGSLAVTGYWTNLSQTSVTSAGSTVVFQYGPSGAQETVNVDPGGQSFDNVAINRAWNDTFNVTSNPNSLLATGNFTIDKVGAMNGSINVGGDVTSNWNHAIGGTALITMFGSHSATLSGPGQFAGGGIYIGKNGVTVSLGSNMSNIPMLMVTSGTLDLGSYTLGVKGNLTVQAGATLSLSPNSATTQVTVGGTLDFQNQSFLTVIDAGIPSNSNFPLITALNVTNEGATTSSPGLTLTITLGTNGYVYIQKA